MTDTTQTLRVQPVRSAARYRRQIVMTGLRAALWTVSRFAPQRGAQWVVDMFTTPPANAMPKREAEWLAGSRYSRMRFGAKGFLSLYAWGRGPTVLLVHGFGGRASQLGAFVVPLVAAGYHVVGFDAPAHGKSDGERSALPEFCEAIKSVAAHIGPIEAVVAHSLGGAAVAAALVDGLECQKAVLIAPPEYPGLYLAKIGRLLGASETVIGRAQALMERRYGRPFDDFRTLLNATVLTQPALILHDTEDRQVPFADGMKVAKAWPGAEFEMTEGLGHNRILRDPAIVARVVAFLSRGSA